MSRRSLHPGSTSARSLLASSPPIEDNRGPLGLRLLYAPAVALVDIIFVHGLNGGSLKSWCVAGDRQTFWPQEWLPQEPSLQHARIHTFGYPAGFVGAQANCLDLNDLGRSLLDDIVTSPTLRADQNVSLVPKPRRFFNKS